MQTKGNEIRKLGPKINNTAILIRKFSTIFENRTGPCETFGAGLPNDNKKNPYTCLKSNP